MTQRKIPTASLHSKMAASSKKPDRPTKRSSGKGGRSAAGESMQLVTVVGCALTVGFIWVVWPLITDLGSSKDNEHEAQRLSRENPDAEVFNLSGEEHKKKP